MKYGKRCLIVLVATLMGILTLAQVTPPSRINYQGVVRDASGNPLNGLVTMTFRFYDDATAGTLLWEEIYDLTVYPPQLTASGGLFTVALGDAAHRNGGSETVFTDIFSNHADLYLAVKVAGDDEMAPRVRVVSAPFAENCDTLDGKHAADFLDASSSGNFLDTSATPQTKAGKLTLTSTVDYGIHATGLESGGLFTDLDNGAYAYVAYNDRGILAQGRSAGGEFEDQDGSGRAIVGQGDNGIYALGNTTGGYFKDIDSSGEAYVGYGNYGIDARGSSAGGYFYDSNSVSHAYVANDSYGIRAFGSYYGGLFQSLDYSSLAHIAAIDIGISAEGSEMGGYFLDSNNNSEAYVAYMGYGISARGDVAGGYFTDLTNSGSAHVGYGDYGIDARGSYMGGYFGDTSASGYMWAAYENTGVYGYGNACGGYFEDLDNVVSGRVGFGTYSFSGTGSKSFVQNHPIEKDKVIVYNCPEGDEVATYTRGTAKLLNGEARVKLGETFQWVTNPDLGLTAHVTPKEKWTDLFVESVSTTELVVKSKDGSSDNAFDFIVYGLRIGFEESSIVQEKQQESYIPSFKDHRERYAKYPQLRSYSALERFKTMESSVRGVDEASIDLSRAKALKDAVHEYDPATDPPADKLFGFEQKHNSDSAEQTPDTPLITSPRPPDNIPQVGSATENEAQSSSKVSSAAAADLNPNLLPCFPVSESVEAGDVVVIDIARRGSVRLCALAADPMVVGIAAGTVNDCRTGGIEEISSSRVPLATSGLADCKVDASYGPIHEGDLLISSPTPGHAMRSENPKQGTVIGKALESMESGTGTIKVLVMLR